MSIGGLPGVAKARRAQLFVNREREIALFRQALLAKDTEWNILGIFGVGGIGKTFLIWQFLDICQEAKVPAVLVDALDIASRSISGFQQSVRNQLAEYDLFFYEYDQMVADYRELRAAPSGSTGDTAITGDELDSQGPLRSARTAIDGEFANALNSIAARDGRLVIAIDTFEQIYDSSADAWLRTEFVPRASARILLIIGGRTRLGLEWEQWRTITRSVELQPFSTEATHQLLSRVGDLEIDESAVSAVVEFTQGHPLAIVLLIDLLRSRQADFRELTVLRGELNALVTENLMSSLDSQSKAALETLSILSAADEELLSYLLEAQGLSASEALDSLRYLSFVRYSSRGFYALHSTIKDFIARDLRTRSPSRYQNLHQAAFAYYQRRLERAVDEDDWALAAPEVLWHQLILDEARSMQLFRELFRVTLTKGFYSCCRQLLYTLRNHQFADKAVQREITLLDREFAAKLNHVENLLLVWEKRDSASVCGILARLLGVSPPSSNEISKVDDLTAFALDTTEILLHAKLPTSLPVVILEELSPTFLTVERIRSVLEGLLSPPTRVALLISYARLDNVADLLEEKLRHTYAYDVVLLSRDELLKIASSEDSPGALRSVVLSRIDLLSASPFIISGPALDNMFFGREHELREISERITTANYALIGGRRVGKTSILKRLERVHLRTPSFYPLYHDCSFTPTQAELVQAVIGDKAWFLEPPASPLTSFAGIIQGLPDARLLIILLDEADKLIASDRAAGYPVFNSLRALANAGRCRFVLSGERALRAELVNPNSPLYNFANEILIGRLDFPAVKELVTRPMRQLEIELTDEAKVVQYIWDFTSGHPNVVQRLCERLIVRLNQRDDRSLTLDEVDAVVVNPDFLRKDFLNIYWERATALERLCSLVMAADDDVRTLMAVHEALTSRGVEVALNQVDDALERLVDLRNILKRTAEGYDFAVTAFPEVIAKTARLDDLIALNRETYQRHGDVEPRSKRGASRVLSSKLAGHSPPITPPTWSVRQTTMPCVPPWMASICMSSPRARWVRPRCSSIWQPV